MTDHRKDSGSGDEARSGRERSSASGSGGGSRQHRSPRHHGRRKERVLHTRISEQLSQDIRELAAASHGARNVAEVFRRCGRRPKCGKCLPDVAELIEAAREDDQGAAKLAAE